MKNVNNYALYDENTKTLYGTHNAGFYSCINTTRLTLFSLISQGIIPKQISFKRTLLSYKETPDEEYFSTLYQISQIPNFKDFNFQWFCPTLIHYDTIDFINFKPINDCFFGPSNIVLNCVSKLIDLYKIDLTNTLAVFHRGNDKYREAVLANPKDWIKQVETIIQPNSRILLQTDEENTKNIFINHFKDKCFYFNEMLFTNTYTKPVKDFKNWAITFESIVRIISQCTNIITHSGNCGFVPVIYRGNTKNVTQLLSNGTFITF